MTPLFVALLTAHAAATPDPGLYRLEMWVKSEIRLPVFGWTTTTTRSVLEVELGRGDRGWVQRHRVCAIAIDTPPLLGKTSIPPATVARLPVRTASVVIGERYEADLGVEILGYAPDGPMPQTPEDPGVLDLDRDGHPGFTVQVQAPALGSHELYVVQRAHMRLVGTVTDGRVEGDILVVEHTQRTLAATHSFLRSQAPTRIVQEESRFVMAPSDGPVCADDGVASAR